MVFSPAGALSPLSGNKGGGAGGGGGGTPLHEARNGFAITKCNKYNRVRVCAKKTKSSASLPVIAACRVGGGDLIVCGGWAWNNSWRCTSGKATPKIFWSLRQQNFCCFPACFVCVLTNGTTNVSRPRSAGRGKWAGSRGLFWVGRVRGYHHKQIKPQKGTRGPAGEVQPGIEFTRYREGFPRGLARALRRLWGGVRPHAVWRSVNADSALNGCIWTRVESCAALAPGSREARAVRARARVLPS